MTSAKVRLIVWGIAAVFLTLLFVGALAKDTFDLQPTKAFDMLAASEDYEQSSETWLYEDISSIHAIRADWASGEVDIAFYEGEELTCSETSSRILQEDQKMYCTIKGGELIIQYAKGKPSRHWLSFMPDKHLVVRVPASMQIAKLKVDSASANIKITGEGAAVDELSLESMSGDIRAERLHVRGLDIEAVSGKISFAGAAKEVDVETVSGEIAFDFDTLPLQLDAETVSGDIRVLMPEGEGFDAELESVSGKLHCDFEQGQSGTKHVYHGNGKARLEFESISGSVTLQQRIALSTDRSSWGRPERPERPERPSSSAKQTEIKEEETPEIMAETEEAEEADAASSVETVVSPSENPSRKTTIVRSF